MITWVRTANIHDGKVREAFSWAVKATKYINEKFDVNVQVARNIGGPLFQLHWVGTYPSLAAFEKVSKQIEADEGYQGLLAEIRQQGVFIGTKYRRFAIRDCLLIIRAWNCIRLTTRGVFSSRQR